MADNYVHPKAAWDKLRAAGERRQDLYIYGAVGYGKTTLMRRYLRRRRHVWLNASDLTAERLRSQKLPEQAVVVIDDMTHANDPALREEILRLLADPTIWVLLAGRSPLPTWLSRAYFENGLCVICERDLALTSAETMQLYHAWNVQVPPKFVEETLVPLAEGNPVALRQLAVALSSGESLSEDLLNDIVERMWQYLNHKVYDAWAPELCEDAMRLSLLDHFTLSQAEAVTGRSDANRTLARLNETGNLFAVSDGVYTMRNGFRNSLRWRADHTCTSDERRAMYVAAARACEADGDISRAMALYEGIGERESISRLLIQSIRQDPSGGKLAEQYHYYIALTDEQVLSSVDLMAARCLLHSQILEAAQSDRWYNEIVKAAAADDETGRAAKRWQVYLDLSLPHRSGRNFSRTLLAASRRIVSDGLELPPISVTDGLPSILNGKRDLWTWIVEDQSGRDIESLQKAAAKVFGHAALGIDELIQAEYCLERGGDRYEAMSHANRGIMMTAEGGRFELQFVGATLLARMYFRAGHAEEAQRTLEETEKHAARSSGTEWVLRNLHAMICRFRLQLGDVAFAKQWLENSATDPFHVNLLDQYCSLTRARVLIAQEQYDRAGSLLTRIKSCAEAASRPRMQIETELLESIVRYRDGDAAWEELFARVLSRAEEYGLVYPIACEGAALLELLQDTKCPEQVSQEFYDRITADAKSIAAAYPKYLSRSGAPHIEGILSDSCLQVLRMQARGLSRSEIATQLHLTERRVKYQSEQTYRKLGVSNKVEAIAAARRLKLL